jgi:hypothetical protein
MKKKQSVTIAALATAVYDNGRRGMPKPGCDCVQCFGYCLVDAEVALRESFAKADSSELQEAIVDKVRS